MSNDYHPCGTDEGKKEARHGGSLAFCAVSPESGGTFPAQTITF